MGICERKLKMTYDYFYGLQAEQFSFYRVPKALFTDEHLCELSTDAKLLYGILLDRMYLSASNGWRDKESRVYIVFTIDEIKDSLRCAEKKAIKLLDELDSAGLIERKRQGLGKPNLIYVKNFIPTPPKGQFLNCQNDNSGTVKSTTPELSEAQGSNTYVNNTEINDTDFNPIPSAPLPRARARDSIRYDAMAEQNSMREYLKERLEIEILKQSHPFYEKELDEIFEIILDTLCSHRQTIRVAGEEKPLEIVKSVFMKLDSSNIEYALDCLKTNTTEVRNIRAYILTTLYNTPQTMSNYYSSLVHHDMPYLAK